MVQERFDIIIAGGSFAGLALARALRLALGVTIRLAIIDRTEKNEAPPPDARAFALSAGTKHMLDQLGVWNDLAPEAQPVDAIDITDTSLSAAVRPVLLSYDNHLPNGEPATYVLPAHLLERALLTAITTDTSIAFRAPAEMTGFTADDHGVTVAMNDGTSLAASLLIGAEGRRSPSRDDAGLKTIGWRYGQVALVTTIAHQIPHKGRAIQHFLPAGPFALLPLTGNRCCITWSEEATEARRILALDDAGFLSEIEERVAGRLGALTLAGPRQSWPLDLTLARSYVAPRYALIGDAAHGVHPIAGQGVNLAFRDVAALAETVAEAARLGLDIGSLDTLKQYERWRRFDNTVSAATFDGLNHLFSNDSDLLRAVRDFGLSAVDRSPMLKRYFVSEAAGMAGDVPRLLKGEPV